MASEAGAGADADAGARVWFYLIAEKGETARLKAACRVAEKAWAGGRQVLVCAADPRAAADFDKLLWTFRQDSFVPHAMVTDASDEDRVRIGTADACAATAAQAGADVVLVLGDEAPPWALEAKRVAAFVGGDDSARAVGRQAFKRWQALGERPHAVSV